MFVRQLTGFRTLPYEAVLKQTVSRPSGWSTEARISRMFSCGSASATKESVEHQRSQQASRSTMLRMNNQLGTENMRSIRSQLHRSFGTMDKNDKLLINQLDENNVKTRDYSHISDRKLQLTLRFDLHSKQRIEGASGDEFIASGGTY